MSDAGRDITEFAGQAFSRFGAWFALPAKLRPDRPVMIGSIRDHGPFET